MLGARGEARRGEARQMLWLSAEQTCTETRSSLPGAHAQRTPAWSHQDEANGLIRQAHDSVKTNDAKVLWAFSQT